MLEAAQYTDNCFATLTYDEEHLPDDNSVHPKVLADFMKRLRKQWNTTENHQTKLRYFGVGEYGDGSMRPHYHLAIFGLPTCQRGITRFSRAGNPCCSSCERIRKSWPYGNIMLGTLEPKSIAYIAGYVVKKMTKDDDPRLGGRFPEFARMSLRPGIGLGMMDELASTLLTLGLDDKMIDVPMSLQHGSKKWPLGRYLRRKLRERIGRDPNTPLAVIQEQKEKMQPLREAAFEASESLQKAVAEASKGKIIQVEARERRYRKRSRI